MKAVKLKLKNVGIISDTEIEINKPMLMFYGDIQQGKTTILNSIKWLAGGKVVSIPKNLIKTGEKEACIELELENGRIRREFYINASGNITARKLEAVIDRRILNQDEVTSLFNPFLLDQNHFVKMNTIDKTKFLLESFGVDTSNLDNEAKQAELEAKQLRSEIKMYGEIDLTVIQKPDTDKLKAEELNIRNELNELYLSNKSYNEKLRLVYQNEVKIYEESVEKWRKYQEIKEINYTKVSDCLNVLMQLGYTGNEVEVFKKSMPRSFDIEDCDIEKPIEPTYITELPDQSKLTLIQEQISNCKANDILYDQYLANVKRNEEKLVKEQYLKDKEYVQKRIKSDKSALLNTISGKIKGLEFNDSGDFEYMNTASDMLSDSQQMELSSKLSSLYPEGLQIELIDRGESLGKSVFLLVKEAEKNNRSVLVSIVGNSPANTPENIGVFVVEKGIIQHKLF